MDSSPNVVSMDQVRTRLSANLRRLRAERDISQERLALEAGVDRTMLSKIERQISNPSIETLLKLANRLSVDIVALIQPIEGLANAAATSYSTRGRPRRGPTALVVHEPRVRAKK
jgi:transcriptional regulator with XRE-family HTH domain